MSRDVEVEKKVRKREGIGKFIGSQEKNMKGKNCVIKGENEE